MRRLGIVIFKYPDSRITQNCGDLSYLLFFFLWSQNIVLTYRCLDNRPAPQSGSDIMDVKAFLRHLCLRVPGALLHQGGHLHQVPGPWPLVLPGKILINAEIGIKHTFSHLL